MAVLDTDFYESDAVLPDVDMYLSVPEQYPAVILVDRYLSDDFARSVELYADVPQSEGIYPIESETAWSSIARQNIIMLPDSVNPEMTIIETEPFREHTET